MTYITTLGWRRSFSKSLNPMDRKCKGKQHYESDIQKP